MSEVITLTNGQITLTTRRTTALCCPLIAQGLGDAKALWLDLEDDALRALLEVCRNAEHYAVPNAVRSQVEAAFENGQRDRDRDYCKLTLNVGGTVFYTTRKTLSQTQYFEAQLGRWPHGSADLGFFDRDPVAFAHVLRKLREPSYSIPDAFKYELLYWGLLNVEVAIQEDELKLDALNFNGNLESPYLTGNPQITFWKRVYRRHTDYSREPKLVTVKEKGNRWKFALDESHADVLYESFLLLEFREQLWDRDDPRGVAQLVESVQLVPKGSKKRRCFDFDGWSVLLSLKNKQKETLFQPIRGSVNRFLIPVFFYGSTPGQAHPLVACDATITVRMSSEFRGSVSLLFDAVTLNQEEQVRFRHTQQEYLLNGPIPCEPFRIVEAQQSIEIPLHWFKGPIYSVVVALERTEHGDALLKGDGALLVSGKPKALFNELLESRHNWGRPLDDNIVFYRMDIALDPNRAQPSGNVTVNKDQLAIRIQASTPCLARVWLYAFRVLQLDGRLSNMRHGVTLQPFPIPPMVAGQGPQPLIPPALVPLPGAAANPPALIPFPGVAVNPPVPPALVPLPGVAANPPPLIPFPGVAANPPVLMPLPGAPPAGFNPPPVLVPPPPLPAPPAAPLPQFLDFVPQGMGDPKDDPARGF